MRKLVGRSAPATSARSWTLRGQGGDAAPALHQGISRARRRPALGRPRNRRAQAVERARSTRFEPAIVEQQQKLIDLQKKRRHADQGPEGNQPADVDRRSESAPREARDDRGQPASRDLDRQEVHEPRPAVPRPDPGRQHRPDEGGGQVRIPPRLQILDVCDVVDPPGDHAFDRRPGAHHPYPGAHDRDDQQDEPHLAPDPAGDRAGARSRRCSPRRWRCPRRRSARS